MSYQPEGEEDLAVYDGDRLDSVVQVKARSNPLTMSTLGKDFFRRVANLPNDVDVLIASFGELGQEMEGLRNRDEKHISSVSRKIQKQLDLTEEQAKAVAGRLHFERLNEDALLRIIHEHLGSTLTAGDPEKSFQLLIWWIYQSSESDQRLTAESLRDRLQSIGRYLAEREAHHEEWFTTIKPLIGEAPTSRERRDQLAEQYYRGASARYSHIQAGLDIKRVHLLRQIEGAFRSGKQTIILHGASGQGKTTLALRYLHDHVPSDWRFMVETVEDRRHATQVANALADHLRAVDAPLFLLIDVAPTDYDWVSLVRELLDKPNVRILIAIRAEDLARRRASDSELGFPADIPLSLPREEAEHIYDRLIKKGSARNPFPTFSDAWERFGMVDGPLLEFVYLITQTNSLRDKLEQQVRRLRNDVRTGILPERSLRFLHLCAVGTAYESRVLLRPLAEYLGLSDPQGLLGKLEEEYLIRRSNDRRTVEALHPLRSVVLKEILSDPALQSTEEIASEVLPFIPEADLHGFLLYVFSRHPDHYRDFLSIVCHIRIATWHGASGVARALLWLGLRQYRDRNRQVIQEARALAGVAWIFLLAPDVAGATQEDFPSALRETMALANPDLIAQLENLRTQLSPTEEIFSSLKNWLPSLRLTSPPRTDSDWDGLAQLLLWSGRLDVELGTPTGLLDQIPVERLSLETLADVAVALHEALPDSYERLLKRHGETLSNRVRKETRTPVLENGGSEIKAHFIVPLSAQLVDSASVVDLASHKSSQESKIEHKRQGRDREEGMSINDRAVYRASLLRRLFPTAERFSTQGHGHQIHQMVGGFELIHDDSRKTIDRKNLPLPRLIEINSIFSSLEEYDCRPSDWGTFAAMLLDIRDRIASTFLQLKRSLTKYFERTSPHNIIDSRPSTTDWDQALALTGSSLSLPMTAVDEWGLSSESKAKGVAVQIPSASIASEVAARRHRALKKGFQGYLDAAQKFMINAGVVCFCHGQWGRQPARRDEIVQLLASSGYDDSKLRLSKHSLFEMMSELDLMQTSFDTRLASLVDPEKLRRIKSREGQLFPELWALWYQFCHHPDRRLDSADVRSMSLFEDAAQRILSDLRSNLGEATREWTVVILSERFNWEGRRALALQIDLRKAIDLEAARAAALDALGRAMGGEELGSLGSYALSFYWPNIIVVPTLGGVALEEGAWIIPSFVFSGATGESTIDRPWLRLLQPFSAEAIESLGLAAPPVDLGAHAKGLQESLTEISAIFAHVSNFEELIEDLDDTGEEVLQEYFTELIVGRLRDRCEEARGLLTNVISCGDRLLGSRPELRDALVEPLEQLREALDEGIRAGLVEFSVVNAASNAQHFGELAGHAALLRLAELGGSAEVLLDV